MKKTIAIVVLLALVFSLAACGGGGNGTSDDGPVTLRVGIVGAFNVHWYAIQEMVAEDGIELELVYFTDFTTPNRALSDGDLDLNAFQHKLFFGNDVEANGYEIEYIAETFIFPLNIFKNQDRISTLADIQDGHTIGIPSDPTNSGRALRLLEAAGLLVIDPALDIFDIPTELDIKEFIVDINLLPAESAMLPNLLEDLEAAIITNPLAFVAGLTEEDSIFTEDITGEFASQLINIIAVRSEDMEDPDRSALFASIVRAHHTEEIRQLVLEEYEGVLVPVW